MALGVDESVFEPPANEEDRQKAVQRSGAIALRGNAGLRRISDAAATTYGVPISGVTIIDRERQIYLARKGIEVWESLRGESFCAVAIHRPGEALIVPDTLADARFARRPGVRSAPFLRFYAGVPILDKGGYALGALCIADTAPRTTTLDPTELMMLAREVERIIAR